MSLIYSFDERFSFDKRKMVKRMTVSLPGAGCSYHKETGGCSMCGFHKATQAYSFGGKLYPSWIFKSIFSLAVKRGNEYNVEEVMIFNGGSFFNDQELPGSFQKFAIRKFASESTASRLIVESRCEYLTENKLSEMSEILGGKELSVAIGFESYNDYIRNNIIKKSLSKSFFEDKISLLKSFGFSVMAYVFLKPLGLSEKDALADVLGTIKYLVNLGVDEMSLSSAFVQNDTKMHQEYLSGNFKPPWLWTILEIIKEVKKNSWPLFVGYFDDNPKPIAIPENCHKCSPDVYGLIDDFRRNFKLGDIPECSCKSSWQKEML